MRKTVSDSKPVEQTAPLLERDGCTLRPVEARWLESIDTMQDYLSALDGELKKDFASYVNHAYPLLMLVLIDAANDAGVLRERELRGLLLSGVQWLRLYKDLLGAKLRDAHVEVIDNDVNAINIPFPLMSWFIDFILFMVELTDPRINLLTMKRRRYDILHQSMLWDDYGDSPVQEVSQIAWRRHLLHDKDYLQSEKALIASMGRTWWVAVASDLIRPEGGWFVCFEKGDLSKPRLVAPGDKGWEWVGNFLAHYQLEMIGTYLGESKGFRRFHIMPRRVHVRKSRWGVQVDIPRFYKWENIRYYLDKDFKDLKALLEQRDEVKLTKGTDSFLTTDELRRVGIIIRKALLKGGKTKDYANTVIQKLGGSLNLERIIGGTSFTEVKDMPPVPRLMKIIDACIDDYTTAPQQRLLWAEFCRSKTYYDSLVNETD